jgi:hypothetical protein
MRIETLTALVSRLLFERWDPIGINGDPQWPRDEYEGYAAGVLGLVLRHESDEAVAEHLARIEDGWMGMAPTPLAHRVQVARAIREAVRRADRSETAG